MKCIFCGADAQSAGGNSFRCPYCGGTFEGEKPREIEQPRAEVKPAVPEPPKETFIEKKEEPRIVCKKDFISLDDMAREAHEKHLTYGQLQKLETLKRRNEF